MQNRSSIGNKFIFLIFNRMAGQLIAIALLLYSVNQCQATEQCKTVNPISKFEQRFDCPPNKPYCCDGDTAAARCCTRRNNEFINIGLTVVGIISMVFAAILCAGCGSKKEEGPPPAESQAQTQSQIAEQQDATPSGIDSKKSGADMKSQMNSKIGKDDKKPQSTVEMASAISALDSKTASSAGSTIESRTSNIASRTSGIGSSISSKVGSSALDSKASSTASSLDSKASSAVGSTVGQSNIGSSLASRSAAGSAMGSRLESRASSAVASRSGMDSSMGSRASGSRVSGTGSNIDGSKISGTGSNISSKVSKS